jgi:hypothetical protein
MFVPILIGIDNPETVAGVDDGQAAGLLAGRFSTSTSGLRASSGDRHPRGS